MKVLTIVGARPQFVKAAMVSRSLRKHVTEILVHTGQHYDVNMSDLFFQELEIPRPDYHLGIGSGSHGAQTGKMLEAIETILLKERPDQVLVYGDTNSTLAGALAAVKLHIPIGHVEAGLRSFNRQMPEEINRIMTDHISTFLFPPTQTAVAHLQAEGITAGVHLVGDVMYDAFRMMSQRAAANSTIIADLGLGKGEFFLLTLHRAENTDNPSRLAAIIQTINQLDRKVIFPAHPRTQAKLKEYGIKLDGKAIQWIQPVGYFDMLNLELNAGLVLTDSGGVQKEAYMAKVPCITLRDETEWVETVTAKWNCLVGADPEAIREALELKWLGTEYPQLFGDGTAAEQIAQVLAGFQPF